MQHKLARIQNEDWQKALESAQITMSDLAVGLGVARSAVSNWRDRNPSEVEFPFPAPVGRIGNSQLFSIADIVQWLSNTKTFDESLVYRGAILNCSGIKKLESSLEDAANVAAILAYSRSVKDDFGHLSDDVANALSLALSVCSREIIIQHLFQKSLLKRPEFLGVEGQECLAEAIACVIRDHLVKGLEPTVVAKDCAGLVLVAAALRKIAEDDRPKVTIVLPKAWQNDSDAPSVAVLAKASLKVSKAAIKYRKKISGVPSHSIVVSSVSHLDSGAAESYFDGLTDILLDLDESGCAFVVAPSVFLIEHSDAEAARARAEFLTGSKNTATQPLVFAAKLPSNWGPNLGKRQLALWVFKRQQWLRGSKAENSASLILAELPKLSEKQLTKLANNIVQCALSPDEVDESALVGGEKYPVELALRSNLGVRQRRTVKLQEPALKIGALDPMMRDSGVDLDLLKYQDAKTEKGSFETVSWEAALNGAPGFQKVVQRFSGLKTSSLEISMARDLGTVVLGKQELHGEVSFGSRSVNILEAVRQIDKFELTQPGDVVFVAEGRNAAYIDRAGGVLVESPAAIVRPREFRGRSKEKLTTVTTPELLAWAINSAESVDKTTWRIPVVPVHLAPHLHEVGERIYQKRTELELQLQSVNVFEEQILMSLLTGTINPRAS